MPDTDTPADEGTVNYGELEGFINAEAGGDEEDAAAAAGDGKPAGDEDPNEIVEVRLKGRTVKMTREAAKAFEEFRADVRKRDGRLGGEISQYKERLARLEGKVEATQHAATKPEDDIQPPDPKLALEDLGAWQAQMMRYNAAMLARTTADIVKQTRAEQTALAQVSQTERAALAWTEGFYMLNPELKSPELRDVVAFVYGKHRKEIEGLEDVQEQYDLLADKVTEFRAKLRGDSKADRPPRLAGGKGSARTPGKAAGDQTPARPPVTAASWQAKERQRLLGSAPK